MEKEKLTRLKVLRVMSYDLLHFLIREKNTQYIPN